MARSHTLCIVSLRHFQSRLPKRKKSYVLVIYYTGYEKNSASFGIDSADYEKNSVSFGIDSADYEIFLRPSYHYQKQKTALLSFQQGSFCFLLY